MAKWKSVKLGRDLLSGNIDGLIGIEELQCPSSVNVVYGDLIEKKKTEDEKRPISVKKKLRKKKALISGRGISVKKENATSHNFMHHDKMLPWNGFGLRDEILASLYEQGFFEPTEIQMKSLGPSVCGFRDILGAAETGSGKTLAFGIPIINGILNLKAKSQINQENSDKNANYNVEKNNTAQYNNAEQRSNNHNNLFALILTPTRELAVQLKDHLSAICKYTDINIVLVVGGLSVEKQERLLKKKPEIIVATPGRLWDLIQLRNDYLQDINKIRYLAIDETDRMVEKGHFDELNNLLEAININYDNKKQRQNFLFSATLTLVHEPPSYIKADKRKRITPGQKLQELIKKTGMTNPKIIDVTNTQITPNSLSEHKIVCRFEEKDYYLHYFLRDSKGKKIVFCNSIGCVKRLANLLNILGYNPLPLHANMMQKQRLKNLEKFRDHRNSILIATDVAARGLDIPDVVHVLHYQVPKTAEIYVHRSGRTARKNKSGNVLLLIEPKEYKYYSKLIHTLGRGTEIDDLHVDSNTLNCLQKVIHLARDIDQLLLAMKKQNSVNNWYSKTISEMDLIVDEDDLPEKISVQANKKLKQDLSIKRKKLKELLQKYRYSLDCNQEYPNSKSTFV